MQDFLVIFCSTKCILAKLQGLTSKRLGHPGRHETPSGHWLNMQIAPQTFYFIFHSRHAIPKLEDGMHLSIGPTSSSIT